MEVGGELIKALLEIYEVKEVCIFSPDQLKGLMLGLYDRDGRYLGFGLLRGLDVENRSIEVFTSVGGEVGRIEFGEIKLNDDLKEVVTRVP